MNIFFELILELATQNLKIGHSQEYLAYETTPALQGYLAHEKSPPFRGTCLLPTKEAPETWLNLVDSHKSYVLQVCYYFVSAVLLTLQQKHEQVCLIITKIFTSDTCRQPYQLGPSSLECLQHGEHFAVQ